MSLSRFISYRYVSHMPANLWVVFDAPWECEFAWRTAAVRGQKCGLLAAGVRGSYHHLMNVLCEDSARNIPCYRSSQTFSAKRQTENYWVYWTSLSSTCSIANSKYHCDSRVCIIQNLFLPINWSNKESFGRTSFHAKNSFCEGLVAEPFLILSKILGASPWQLTFLRCWKT